MLLTFKLLSMSTITSLFKRLVVRKESVVAVLAVVLLLGAGAAHAAFTRVTGSAGFLYGYGYGYEMGYGYLDSELDADKTAAKGFAGDDGKVTGVSAVASSNYFTVTYTSSYEAKNRIQYGTTDSFGSQTSQSGFQSGTRSITVSGLSCGTTYHYRVQTTDAGNNVWYSTGSSHTIQTNSCGSSRGGGSSQTSRIAALQSQLAQLQAQLAALLGSDTSAPDSVRDLTVGMTGTDVTALQTLLIAQGHPIPAGATGFFATQTLTALSAYQAAHGIVPAAGYFGAITRAQMKAANLPGLWW